jgi:hypothetical protein
MLPARDILVSTSHLEEAANKRGNQQVLCEAAAVLVALATSLAADLDPITLLSVLGKWLTVASTSNAIVGITVGLFRRHVRVIINSAVLVGRTLVVG